MSLKAAAVAFSVSPATAHRWWHRWLDASEEARASLSCLFDRLEPSPSLAAPARGRVRRGDPVIADARRAGGRGSLAERTGFPHSTVWKVRKRAGLSRPARAEREPARRYEWPCPGDLLHMDVSEYVRFEQPGHRVTGDRSSQDRQHRDGIDYVHAIIDDRSRLAYAEVLDDAKAATSAAFLKRALDFYTAHGITAKRLMTDNAWAYTRGKDIRQLLTRREIRHLTTKPYRPQTNGKVERFHQTGTANGPTASPTPPITNEHKPCHTGSTTTTTTDHTAHSEADHQSAAFTTSVGRTPSGSNFEETRICQCGCLLVTDAGRASGGPHPISVIRAPAADGCENPRSPHPCGSRRKRPVSTQ